MEPELIFAIVFRWIHVLAAVVAIGGLLFLRFVLLPAAQGILDAAQIAALRDRVMRRWRPVVLACITLLLVSGFYNFFTIALPKAEKTRAYHPLFGLKFLAALGVFFIASVLTGRSPAFGRMRANATQWLSIAAGLAILVILISGILKNLPVGP